MNQTLLEGERVVHYQIAPSKRVTTMAGAARYVNRFGFCWLFAPRDRKLELPALFEAVKGRRDAHIEEWDSDSDTLWAWKNDLPAAHRVYYGKALAGKPVFISLEHLPHVLAALGLDDVSEAYAHGAVSYDARRIYEALEELGAQPTQNLKRSAGFVGKQGGARYHRALAELQTKLVVASIGTTNEGAAWPSQIFDLVARWFEPQANAAKKIDLRTARLTLIERYLKTVLAAPPDALARLFAIPRPELRPLLDELESAGRVRAAQGWVLSKSFKNA